MVKGLIIADNNQSVCGITFDQPELDEIYTLIDVCAHISTPDFVINNPAVMAEIEVMLCGWGEMPCLNKEFLEAAPNLKAIFYAGGSIKNLISKEFLDRDILITSGYQANAISVAQYTLSQILACLKGLWHYAKEVKALRDFPPRINYNKPGVYQPTIGLLSLGAIGWRVCRYLQEVTDARILAYDPYFDPDQAKAFNVEMCSLEYIFKTSDVVSVHIPLLPETKELICRKHFLMMKPHSSLINTSRGHVINEREMIDALQQRPDITAVLDVTHPEPPTSESVLYDMENVIITPHIAGAIGTECQRLGRYMVEELARYVRGEKLKWVIDCDKLETSA